MYATDKTIENTEHTQFAENTENTFGIEVTRLKILCLTVFTAVTLCFTLFARSWEEDEGMEEKQAKVFT